MLTKKEQRLRRSRQTRIRIANQGAVRLSVFRSNLHIYASVISDDGLRVVASASTAEKEVREQIGKDKGGNTSAAAIVGKRVAEKAIAAGVSKVAFDRSGFAYHGRVKALAEAAREAGLQFCSQCLPFCVVNISHHHHRTLASKAPSASFANALRAASDDTNAAL